MELIMIVKSVLKGGGGHKNLVVGRV